MSSHCNRPVNNRTTFNHIHTCSVITDSKDIVYSRWIHDALFTRSPACKDNHIERKYYLYIEQGVYAQVCSVSMNELPPPPPPLLSTCNSRTFRELKKRNIWKCGEWYWSFFKYRMSSIVATLCRCAVRSGALELLKLLKGNMVEGVHYSSQGQEQLANHVYCQ